MKTINIGDTIRCVETQREFIAARDGCTFNYARTAEGEPISDEGVNLRSERELLDHSRPLLAYLSSDGRIIGTWKGHALMHVDRRTTSRTGWHGSTLDHVRATDIFGHTWHGKGAGRGMCIRMHACKGK